MKTKELIRQLMEEDPTGEEEVCVGNIDIHFVSSEPAYWDGSLQVLQRDPSKAPYYNIVGGKYKRSGVKIQIHTLSISDAISNAHRDGEFLVDYSELDEQRAASTKKAHDDLREWHKKLDNKLEWENFLRWVKDKVKEEDKEDIEGVSLGFFEKNIKPDDPLPNGGIPSGHSYVSCRHMQWDQKYEVCFDEGFFKIKKKEEVA